MGVILASISIYRRILNYGAVDSIRIKNLFSPLLYCAYLLLGFASFLWSTNPGFSALQWMMTIQSLDRNQTGRPILCVVYDGFEVFPDWRIADRIFPHHAVR
jgi:hypothetical protein